MDLACKKFSEFSKLLDDVQAKREDLKLYIFEHTKNKIIREFLELYKYEVDFFADFNTLSFIEEFTKCAYHKIELDKSAPKELLENGYRENNSYDISYCINERDDSIGGFIVT